MSAAVTRELEHSIWVIRAGVGGEAHRLFIEESVVALGDPGLGNLQTLDATRAAFCRAYSISHPAEAMRRVRGIVGKFFRFAHEVRLGDLVIYPAIPDRRLYIGEINGEYAYVRIKKSPFRHRRSVKWLGSVLKSDLSQQAQRELGAARTFFRMQRARSEVIMLLNSTVDTNI
jgi:restriction system protein